MIDFHKVKFVKSAPNVNEKPEVCLDELLFVGRSNVGKSSLLNAIVNQKMAFVSSKPGHTKLLNYFLIDNKFYLVDAPGYGFTQKGSKYDDSFSEMMENYFENKNLKGVVFLLDSRRVPSEDDVMFYDFLVNNDVDYIIALSKCDKLNQKETHQALKNLKTKLANLDEDKIVYTSIKIAKSIEELKKRIASLL